MMGDAVPEQSNPVERGMSLLAYKRCRAVDEELPQVRTPEVGFVPWTEKANPEPEVEFGDNAVRFERSTLEANTLLGPIDVLLLRMAEAEARRIVPTGAECLG